MRDDHVAAAQPAAVTATSLPATPRSAPHAITTTIAAHSRDSAMPFAWLDLDLLDKNIRAVVGRCRQ